MLLIPLTGEKTKAQEKEITLTIFSLGLRPLARTALQTPSPEEEQGREGMAHRQMEGGLWLKAVHFVWQRLDLRAQELPL